MERLDGHKVHPELATPVERIKGNRIEPVVYPEPAPPIIAPTPEIGPIVTGHKVGRKRESSVEQLNFKLKLFGSEDKTHVSEARIHVQEKWTHTYLLTALSLVGILSLIVVIMGGLAIFTSSGKVFLSCGLLLIVAVIFGLLGAKRVAQDVRNDDDGIETAGQRMLQVYFHFGLAFLLLFTPFAFAICNDPTGFEGDLLQTIKENNSSLLLEELSNYLYIAGMLSISISLVIATSLYSVVKIVTVYEIAQSFLETFAATLIILCVMIMGFLLAIYRQTSYMSASASIDDHDESIDVWIIFCVVCAMLMMGLSIVGFFAAWYETRRLLLIHAIGLTILGVVFFVVGILITTTDKSIFIEKHCFEILKTMSSTWWDSVTGCTKYGGTSIGALVENF